MTRVLSAILFTFICLSTISFAEENGQRANLDEQKKSKILSLINREISMIEKLRSYGPNLQFRLIELYAEKIKLLRENENKTLLNAKSSDAFKNKERYFTASNNLYLEMKRMASRLILNAPNYEQLPQLHYIMGINSRDFDQGKETEKHLLKVLRFEHLNSTLENKTNVALAEFYYNEKKYQNAIKHYLHILGNAEDPWRAKHQYNLSWCYFKLKQFEPAIESLEKSFELSQDKKYISVEEQVLDTLSIFHTNGGQVKRAIDFYLKNVKTPAENLMILAERAAKKGDQNGAKQAIAASLSSIENKGSNYLQLELRALNMAREFANETDYFVHANSIAKNITKALEENEIKEQISQEIRSFTGYLQENLIKKYSAYSKDEAQLKLKRIIDYFDLISIITPKQKAEMLFFQGETHYAIKIYTIAANYYIRSLQESKKNKTPNNDLIKKDLDALLASLEKSDFNEKLKQKYLLYTYENYIQYFPTSETAQLIYPKLNNLYLAKNELKYAEKTLSRYSKSFPKDIEEQQLVVMAIIDRSIKTNNSYNVAQWVERIRKGEYQFSVDYIKKSQILLANMLFQRIKKQEGVKDKEWIINEYVSIYNDNKYPQEIKEEAAYNIAISYLNAKDTTSSAKWLFISNTLRSQEKTKNILSDLNAINIQYYLRQDLPAANETATYLLNLSCRGNLKKQNEYFTRALSLSFAIQNFDKVVSIIESIVNCKEINNDTAMELLNSKIIEYFKLTLKLPHKLQKYATEKTWNEIFNILSTAFWNHYLLDEDRQLQQISDQMKSVASIGTNPPLLVAYNGLMKWTTWDKQNRNPIYNWTKIDKMSEQIPFDPSAFNQELEKALESLSSFENSAQEFIKSTDNNIALSATNAVLFQYQLFEKRILMIRIHSQDKDFTKQFLMSMRSIAKGLERKIDITRKNTLSSIDKQGLSNFCTPNFLQHEMIFPKCLKIRNEVYIPMNEYKVKR